MGRAVSFDFRMLVTGVLAAALLGPAPARATKPDAVPQAAETPSRWGGFDFLAEDEAVIVPGNEDLLASIVGKGEKLPGGCEFTGGKIDKNRIDATYQCAGKEVVVELMHPAKAEGAAARTKKFAFRVKQGAPPPELQSALESTIRGREASFEWKLIPLATRRPAASWTLLAGAALAALALLGWLLRSRRTAAG